MKMRMTPAERLIAASNCREPDCVPVVLHGLMPVYFRNWMHNSHKEIGEDLTAKIEMEIEFYQQWPEVVPIIEEPKGGNLIGICSWFSKKEENKGGWWACQNLSRKDVNKKLNKAKVADPLIDERLQKVLKNWQEHIDHLPSDARLNYGGLIWNFEPPGALECIAKLLSYSEVYHLIYEDPKFIHELLDFHTNSVVLWIHAVEALFTRAGLTKCRFFYSDEVLPMLSPDHVMEFCFPYIRRIYEASQSPIKVFHCDNRVTHMTDIIARFGANVFFGNFSDYSILKNAFDNKLALMGNVPSVDTLTAGCPEDVEECCKWLIANCGEGGGFILSTGGGVDPFGNSPLENIGAMVDAAKKYGNYPLSISEDNSPIRYQDVMSAHFSRKKVEILKQEDEHLENIAEQTCQGNLSGIVKVVPQTMEGGISAERIFLDGLSRGLSRATDLFYQGVYFHPEMERANRVFEAGITTLGSAFKPKYYKGRVVIGSLSIHESGIRLLEVMLSGVGLNVTNIGTSIGTEQIIDKAVNDKAQIIAMGVYFYKHVKRAEKVTQLLRERGLAIKTLVGGMGITPQMSKTLKVDAYATDGRMAQEKALELLGE